MMRQTVSLNMFVFKKDISILNFSKPLPVSKVSLGLLSHSCRICILGPFRPLHISRVSCQKGPTRHAYAWPFWQDTLDFIVRFDNNHPWPLGLCNGIALFVFGLFFLYWVRLNIKKVFRRGMGFPCYLWHPRCSVLVITYLSRLSWLFPVAQSKVNGASGRKQPE